MTDQENTPEGAADAPGPTSEGMALPESSLRDSPGTASTRSLHKQLTALRSAQTQSVDAISMDVPESITSALRSWARQLAEEAAASVRDGLSQTESGLASLLRLNEQADAEREELNARLSDIAAERDQALTRLAECDSRIERLTIELRHARNVASDALVSKAKDQLAIEGKEAQLAELRRQVEHHVATFAAESDARLGAEMDLVGAVTARDNFAAELAELRAELDSYRGARSVV